MRAPRSPAVRPLRRGDGAASAQDSVAAAGTYLGRKRAGGLAVTLILAFMLLAAARGGSATAARGAASGAPAQATPPGSASLVVNEIDYRQRGVDNAEFVELANRGPQTVNLGLFAVVGVDGSGQPYRRDRLPQRLLSPGGYFVLGSPLAANVDLVVGSVNIWRDPGSHPNQSAAVAVVMNPTDDAASDVLIDSVSYDGDVPGGPATGGTWTEEAGVTAGDVEATGQIGISRLPDSADTDVNSDDLSARCITPGYANTSAAGMSVPCGPAATLTPSPTPDVAPHVLVVNEVDYVQVGNSVLDFVELKNVSGAPLALRGYQVVGVDGRAGIPQIYRRDALPAVTLPAGAYFVLGNSGVPNVDQDLGPQDVWSGGLGEGPRAIAVVANPGQDPGNDRLVDTVSYEGDVLGGPPLGGTWTETAGLTGGDPAAAPFTGLSRAPDGQDSDINRIDFAARCVTPGYGNSASGISCAAPGTITPTPPASTTPTASITSTPGGTSASPTPTPTGTPGGPPGPARFLVVSPADDDDAQPGDGRCEARTGLCTLRAALREALLRPGQEPVRIEFSGPMEIRVTAGMPLPDVARGGTTLTGAAHLRGGDPGVRIVGPRRGVASTSVADLFHFGGRLFILGSQGRGNGLRPLQVQGQPMPGLIVGGPVTVQGLSVSGFDVGIEVTAFAEGAVIGSDGDGLTD
ncbi:MAG: lamin tail domain-containing protein, partial [Anaerolineae bacterium]